MAFKKYLGAWCAAAGLFLFALLVFRSVLPPDTVFFCSDSNVGTSAVRKSLLPGAFAACWYDSMLAGFASYMPAGLSFGMLALMSPVAYVNWIYLLYLFGASGLLTAFLRKMGLGWPASLLGALAACWLSSNFTLAYAGHTGKFGVLFFAVLGLWALAYAGAAPARRTSAMLVAGGALGMMLVEQADVGLFFAMPVGAYVLFTLFYKWRQRGWPAARSLLLLLGLAGTIALRPAWEGYRENIRDTVAVSQDDPAARWDFATQWSWPPEESIDFIAPGYTGWRSGEPAGPYWGRMGRSAGWETTGQGFQNFKLENVYLGILPVALALLALLAAARRAAQCREYWPAPAAAEVRFWGAVAALSLLLAFGKYFPLYRAFYHLPLVGNIRNPNKFLQVFQLAVAILSAYGLEAAVRIGLTRSGAAARRAGTALLLGLLAVGAVLNAGCRPRVAGELTEWSDLIGRLADSDFIARLDVENAEMVSSSDPTGGNDDFNNFVRPGPPGWVVLADLRGPGYISRFWFTGGRADRRLQFYFDDEKTPSLDTTIGEFCGGLEPFVPPLAEYENLCFYNYVPIPYARRLVVMTEEGGTRPGGWPRLFYQINYASLPPGRDVRSLSLPPDPAALQALRDAADMWNRPGSVDYAGMTNAAFVLAPGAHHDLLLPAGPALLRELAFTVDFAALPDFAAREAVLRSLVARIFWDGAEAPSVDVPLGDFGGSCWRRTRYQSLYFGMTGDTWQVRFPMPFRESARLQLENQGAHPVSLELGLRWEDRAVDQTLGYFHAAWRRSIPEERGRPHTVMDVRGRGRFAGCLLTTVSLDDSFWLLEGDERMWRDGAAQPFWDGTGLEDYFNGGWYYQNVMARPLHGLPDKTFFRTVQYRVHLPDVVGFDESLRMVFERGPENASRGWIESLAWYYLAEPAAAAALPSAADRAPPPDTAGPEGVMLKLLNYERFGDYAGALEFLDGFLMEYPEIPFADILRIRRAVYAARPDPDRLPELLQAALREVADEEARRQARQLLNFTEQPQSALLGLNANMPARVFLDGEVVLQAGTPDQFSVVELELPPGRHVLALQCQPRPYPDWVQLHLRTQAGDVYTAPDWRHAVNPPGAWWLPAYNDTDWAEVGGAGCKGPPEEPYLVLRPNVFVDTQSRAVALRPTVDWPSRTGAVVYRRVFEVPEE